MATDESVRFAANLDSAWMTAHELAEDLSPGITVAVLAQLRKDGQGPAFHTFGRTVVYCREEVEEWITGILRNSTSNRGRRSR